MSFIFVYFLQVTGQVIYFISTINETIYNPVDWIWYLNSISRVRDLYIRIYVYIYIRAVMIIPHINVHNNNNSKIKQMKLDSTNLT